jgi:hypothetical protein
MQSLANMVRNPRNGAGNPRFALIVRLPGRVRARIQPPVHYSGYDGYGHKYIVLAGRRHCDDHSGIKKAILRKVHQPRALTRGHASEEAREVTNYVWSSKFNAPYAGGRQSGT